MCPTSAPLGAYVVVNSKFRKRKNGDPAPKETTGEVIRGEGACVVGKNNKSRPRNKASRGKHRRWCTATRVSAPKAAGQYSLTRGERSQGKGERHNAGRSQGGMGGRAARKITGGGCRVHEGSKNRKSEMPRE